MALIYRQALVAPEVYANSGYPDDIQNAVDQATAIGGGTVLIPAGSFTWNGETVNIPTGVNVFGASPAGCQGHEANWTSNTATTILYNNVKSIMFFVDGAGRTVKASRIFGIQFEFAASAQSIGNEGGIGVLLNRVIDCRVDHCTFINCGGQAVWLDNTDLDTIKGRALVDHCVVDNPYKSASTGYIWGYAFYVRGSITYTNYDMWTAAKWGDARQIFGKYDTAPPQFPILYVEDCHVSRARHSTDGIQGGFYCSRYNLFEQPLPKNFGIVDIHGTESVVGDTVPSYIGGRGFEAYENTVIGQDANYNNVGVMLRGGSALTYNNRFINSYTAQWNVFVAISNDDGANLFPGTHVNQAYIWGNTVIGGTLYENSGGYTENIDYFLRAPTQAQDGFTYMPYTYPHPLTLEGGPTEPTTPFLGQLEEGVYEISAPSIVTDGLNTYNFKQWEDGSTSPTRRISLTSDMALTATYELVQPVTHNLEISTSVGGTTNPVPGTYTLDDGVQQQVAAVADQDYRFLNWELDGTARTENPITILMDRNYTLKAVFEYVPPPQTYALTVTSTPITEVPIKIDGGDYSTPTAPLQLQEGTHTVEVPSIVTTGTDTYNFVQWNDGVTSPNRTVELVRDVSLVAIYVLAEPAQTTLRGTVKDTVGNPLADVDIQCNGLATKTASDGSYELTNLEPKPYTITIAKAGYQTQILQVDASAGGTITLPEVKLSPVSPISAFPIILLVGSFLLTRGG